MSDSFPNVGEIVDVLSIRDGVLAALSTDSRDIRDLRGDLGCSRSTAYKVVRELQTRELAEEARSEYRLTLLGRLLFERHERFMSETDTLLGHGDALTLLPPGLPVDSSVFADATIATPTRFRRIGRSTRWCRSSPKPPGSGVSPQSRATAIGRSDCPCSNGTTSR